MNVSEARPGDVVMDTQKPPVVWQRGDKFCDWSTFSGPVLYYGEWKELYGPQGDLVLLVRDGKPYG